jgi:hypothetical protein
VSLLASVSELSMSVSPSPSVGSPTKSFAVSTSTSLTLGVSLPFQPAATFRLLIDRSVLPSAATATANSNVGRYSAVVEALRLTALSVLPSTASFFIAGNATPAALDTPFDNVYVAVDATEKTVQRCASLWSQWPVPSEMFTAGIRLIKRALEPYVPFTVAVIDDPVVPVFTAVSALSGADRTGLRPITAAWEVSPCSIATPVTLTLTGKAAVYWWTNTTQLLDIQRLTADSLRVTLSRLAVSGPPSPVMFGEAIAVAYDVIQRYRFVVRPNRLDAAHLALSVGPATLTSSGSIVTSLTASLVTASGLPFPAAADGIAVTCAVHAGALPVRGVDRSAEPSADCVR